MYIVQVVVVSEESKEMNEVKIEVEDEVVVEVETREDRYKEYVNGLSSSERERITHASMNIGWRSFPIVALRLQYLKTKEDTDKVLVIGTTLRKHFKEFFKLAAPIETELETAGDKLIEVIKKAKKLLVLYEIHTGFSNDFYEAYHHSWQPEVNNWKKYHDLITEIIKKLGNDVDVYDIPEIHEISTLDLFKRSGPLLLKGIKNIEKEVTGKENLPELKKWKLKIKGAMVYATKIQRLMEQYDDIREKEE